MYDAYKHYYAQFVLRSEHFSHLPVSKDNYLLCTIHRKANTANKSILSHIIEALNEINKEIPVICPLHPNTKKQIEVNQINSEFTIIPPVGYLDMQYLVQNAAYVITDSGGVQREAFFAQKPTLIVMESPFWPELLENGCVINCTGEKKAILNSFWELKKKDKTFTPAVFGNGHAAEIITQAVIDFKKAH